MGKGYLAGAFWGLVLSALVIGSVSLMMPLPERERPVPQPTPAPMSMPEIPALATEDVLTSESFAPVLAPAAPPEAPAPEGAEPQAESAPPPVTAPIVADPEVSAPAALPLHDSEEGADIPASEAPAAPQPEARPAPVMPEPEEEAAAEMPGQSSAVDASETPEASLVGATDDAQAAPLVPTPAAPAPLPVDAGQEPQPDIALESSDDVAVPGALAAVVAPGLPDRPLRPEPEAESLPEIAAQTAQPTPPQPGLRGEVEGVQVGRLPAIGDAEAEPEPEPETPGLPAVLRHAAQFTPVAGRAAFAVVLLDDGLAPAARAALADLPFPVTVALDPLQDGAEEAAQFYRTAGLEVLILASAIPAGATATDLEVTFQAYFAALPEAVALLDLPEGGFQGDRRLAQQVVAVLERDGHGLVTHDRGLNPAAQTAQSAGVANGLVFRLLDADDENAATIRRYLDRAAFKAAQDGRVIVMGRAAHEATLTALLEWRLEGRTDAVVLAPVTAALRMP